MTPPDPAGLELLEQLAAPLTEQELLFCEKYIENGGNGCQAAIDAGYSDKPKSAKVQGSRMLKRPGIILEIGRRRQALTERSKVTLDEIIDEFRVMGFSRITDFVTWDGDGVHLKPESELRGDPVLERKLASINSISCVIDDTFIDAAGKSDAASSPALLHRKGHIKLKMHDKKGSLVKLAEMLGHVAPHRRREGDGDGSSRGGPAVQIIVDGGPTGLELGVTVKKPAAA